MSETYQKIESLIRKCVPIPQKTYDITKRLKTPEEVEKYFPGFMAFVDYTEQQIPRPVDKGRRKRYYSRQEEKTYCARISLWLIIMVISFTN